MRPSKYTMKGVRKVIGNRRLNAEQVQRIRAWYRGCGETWEAMIKAIGICDSFARGVRDGAFYKDLPL